MQYDRLKATPAVSRSRLMACPHWRSSQQKVAVNFDNLLSSTCEVSTASKLDLTFCLRWLCRQHSVEGTCRQQLFCRLQRYCGWNHTVMVMTAVCSLSIGSCIDDKDEDAKDLQQQQRRHGADTVLSTCHQQVSALTQTPVSSYWSPVLPHALRSLQTKRTSGIIT